MSCVEDEQCDANTTCGEVEDSDESVDEDAVVKLMVKMEDESTYDIGEEGCDHGFDNNAIDTTMQQIKLGQNSPIISQTHDNSSAEHLQNVDLEAAQLSQSEGELSLHRTQTVQSEDELSSSTTPSILSGGELIVSDTYSVQPMKELSLVKQKPYQSGDEVNLLKTGPVQSGVKNRSTEAEPVQSGGETELSMAQHVQSEEKLETQPKPMDTKLTVMSNFFSLISRSRTSGPPFVSPVKQAPDKVLTPVIQKNQT